MINKPPPLKGLNIRIPIIIPIKGTGFINLGSTSKSHEVGDLLGTWGAGVRVRVAFEVIAAMVCCDLVPCYLTAELSPLYKLQSKLLVSPLITPVILPIESPTVRPLKEFSL